MSRQTVIISNVFHNSEIALRAEVSGQDLYLSSGQVRRARRVLCGISGCTCGGVLGQRPNQGWDATAYGGAVCYGGVADE